MPPFGWIVFALVLVVAGLVGVINGGSAQEEPATPDAMSPSGDPSVEYVADTRPVSAPGSTLELTRITLPPGGSVGVQDHPGASVMYVESGAIEIVVDAGVINVLRRQPGDPGPVPTYEPCSPSCQIEAGSSAVQADSTRHTLVDISGTGSVIAVTQLTVDVLAGTPEAATPAARGPVKLFGCNGGCR